MSETVFSRLVHDNKLAGAGDQFSKDELVDTVGRYVEAHETPNGTVFETKPSMSIRLADEQRICVGYLIAFVAFETEIVESELQTPWEVNRLVGDIPVGSSWFRFLTKQKYILDEVGDAYKIPPSMVSEAIELVQDEERFEA